MPTQIFKIYDGRPYFWQWDTNQKLIVLDDSISEVHFSNKYMPNAIIKLVYEENGLRVCNVPKVVLQHSENVVAHAASHYATFNYMQFAVKKRPMPDGYVTDNSEDMDIISQRFDLVESQIKDIMENGHELPKFESIDAAELWARRQQKIGVIVAIRIDNKWVAHMVESDFSITPICDIPDSYIIEDEIGNQVTAIVVDEFTLFTATDDDVREGKVYAGDNGVSTGTHVCD